MAETINTFSEDEFWRRANEALRRYRAGATSAEVCALLTPDREIRGALDEAELRQWLEQLKQQYGGLR